MSLIQTKCIEYHENRKICVASENGKTYTLNNKSNYKIKKVRIDKCILQQEGEHRCDFLMHATRDKDEKAYFIELKGGALMDAVQQLYDTIVYLKKELTSCEINARIIGKGDTPNLKNSAYYKKLVREISHTRGTIIRATNKALTENI